MRSGIMIVALLMLLNVSSPGGRSHFVEASEDWGNHCYQVMPFADDITMRLVRPNPPEWNLVAQVKLNGGNVYVLPGGGDLHTDIDEEIYTVNLTFYNTSTFFSAHPIVTLRGVVWGPFSVEARGKVGVATYITQGTLIPAVCESEEVATSSALLFSQHGLKALMGAQ